MLEKEDLKFNASTAQFSANWIHLLLQKHWLCRRECSFLYELLEKMQKKYE